LNEFLAHDWLASKGCASYLIPSIIMREQIIAAIRRVPRGMVSTYGQIARAAGLPRGARQVAQTLHRAFALPWHRIVGAGGEIKLRGESAMEQRLRLEAEGVIFRGRRVDMSKHEYKFGRQKIRRKKKAMSGRSTGG